MCNELLLFTVHFVAISESEEEKMSYAEQNTPYFVIRLTDTEIMEKTFLRFMVKVIGEPRPKIQLLVCSTISLPPNNSQTCALNNDVFFAPLHYACNQLQKR